VAPARVGGACVGGVRLAREKGEKVSKGEKVEKGEKGEKVAAF
jgi:hypothetical protein